MGLLRKAVRKSVRKATPRPVRRVERVVRHPVGTAARAVTPRPIRNAERTVFNVTHPVNTVENRVLDAMIGPPLRYGTPSPRGARRASAPTAPTRGSGRAPATRLAKAHVVSEEDRHREATRVLADRAEPASAPRLVGAMIDADPIVRKLAVRGLGRLKDADLEPHILDALTDRAAEVRIEAIRAAAPIGSERATRALTAASQDANREVARQATIVLAGLKARTVSSASAMNPSEHRRPLNHAVDEDDPEDLALALLVSAHHGRLRTDVRDLLDVLKRGRLTMDARDEIVQVLENAGLVSSPSIDDVGIGDDIELVQVEVIPEFALRAHIDHDGPWTLSVGDLLRMFDRVNLTDAAREQLAEALDYVDLTASPRVDQLSTQGEVTVARRNHA